MGEGYRPLIPEFEYRPELGPNRVERQPVDRFGELKRLLLTEGERPLVSSDIAGMEEMFVEVLMKRGFSFEVFAADKSGGGKNYEVQRGNLVKIVGEPTVLVLEDWGEQLFEAAGRKTHDAKTGKRGIVVAQVVLDLYRFAAKLRTQTHEVTKAEETVEKLNKRIENWKGKGTRNPSGCSGEIMARVIDWMQTGEMTMPEDYRAQ